MRFIVLCMLQCIGYNYRAIPLKVLSYNRLYINLEITYNVTMIDDRRHAGPNNLREAAIKVGSLLLGHISTYLLILCTMIATDRRDNSFNLSYRWSWFSANSAIRPTVLSGQQCYPANWHGTPIDSPDFRPFELSTIHSVWHQCRLWKFCVRIPRST